MKIGLLRETKIPVDNRVALSPKQCKQIETEHPDIRIFVQPSNIRCFTDNEYRKENITVKEDLEECDILIGIKEVHPADLIPDKTYIFFSHTVKKQEHNRDLLKTILSKHIRLIDYEKLSDSAGNRILGFGRWAGLIGTYNGIRALCVRYCKKELPAPQNFKSLVELMGQASRASLPPVRIALTGDGRAAGGAEEMLNAFRVSKITVDSYLGGNTYSTPVYVQLDPEKYNVRKDGSEFELTHFFKYPQLYESNFKRFCSNTDLLIMAAYWDPHAPVLLTAGQMKGSDFSIKVIADITCDIHGSVPSSLRTTTFAQPFYDYSPATGKEEPLFSNPANITVMTIDNLPCGLPAEASTDFGRSLLKSLIPLLSENTDDEIITRATIADRGSLTQRYMYLNDWVNQP